MKTNFLFALITLFIFTNCKQTTSQTAEKTATIQEPVIQMPLVANFGDEKPDTLLFREKDKTFRLLEDTANFRYAIQRMDHAIWQTLDSVDRPRGLSVDDWNKDGYADILLAQRWVIDLMLYNPNTNTFEKPFDIGEPDGAFLLDTTKKLYYSILTNKFQDEQSQLFIIENYRPILRGYIQGFVGDEEYSNRDKPRGVYVYKIKNNTLQNDKLYENANLQLIDKFEMEQYTILNTSQYAFYKQYWEKNVTKFQ